MVGGLFGTVLMTLLLEGMPYLGLPQVDMGAMMGSIFNDCRWAVPYTDAWWYGMVLHLVVGSMLMPLAYDGLFCCLLGSDWLRGVEYGAGLWVLWQLAIIPLLGRASFPALEHHPFLATLGILIGLLAYGFALGAIAGHRSDCRKSASGPVQPTGP